MQYDVVHYFLLVDELWERVGGVVGGEAWRDGCGVCREG